MTPSDGTGASGGWLRAIAARWPIVLTAMVVGIATALAITFLMPRQEGAETTVIPVAEGGALDPAQGDRLPRIASSLQMLAASDAVLQRAAGAYAETAPDRVAPPLEEMRTRVSATVPGESALVTITTTGSTEEEALALGRAEVDALSAVVAELTPAGSTGIGARVVAIGPPVAVGVVSPRPVANAVLGGVAGLLVGVVVVLLIPGIRRGYAGSRPSARATRPARG
jgi:capsular polysaccharide biosynthesis protein